MIALEGDVSRALGGVTVDERQAFRVLLSVAGERLPFAAEDWSDARLAQAFELPPVIIDIGPEPGAGIGDGEQRLAGWAEDERRITAEERRLGVKIDPAAPDKLAEMLAIRILAAEVDGNGAKARTIDAW